MTDLETTATDELAERREEVEDLEVELEAARVALEAEGLDAAKYLKLVNDLDDAIAYLDKRFNPVIDDATVSQTVLDSLTRSIRRTKKGGEDKGSVTLPADRAA